MIKKKIDSEFFKLSVKINNEFYGIGLLVRFGIKYSK